MTDVLLATLFAVDNFGSSLQTYATCKMIEQTGGNVKVINYISPRLRFLNLLFKNQSGNFYSLMQMPKRIALGVFVRKRKKIFNRFLHKYMQFTKYYRDYNELEKNPPKADIYVTGSDQVWNSNYNQGVEKFFYLDFAPASAKRIAFSASIGMQDIPEDEKAETKALLQKYSAISVREDRAKELIEELGITPVKHVLDPTMLLDEDDWTPLMQKIDALEDVPYLLLYQLNKNSDMDRIAQQIAEEKGLKIVKIELSFLHRNKKYFNITFASPNQFLWLFSHASYVVTDSFHGTAFSINFNRQLSIVFPLRFSSRLASAAKMFGLENRIVDKGGVVNAEQEIDYAPINEKLNQYRQEAKEFLRKAIKD